MFDKLSRAAEKVAAGVGTSRRGFLGQIGRGALAASGLVGGLLLQVPSARAGGGRVQACINKCCANFCGKGYKDCSCDKTGSAYANCYVRCTGAF